MAQRFRVEFGVLAVLLCAASAGFAADHEAVISGMVRDGRGAPQVGALVQLVSADAAVRVTAFTDGQGRYLIKRMVPGVYGIRATAAMFTPTLREHLRLQPDRRMVVNLTLSGLFDEFAWLPAKARGSEEPNDDWNWTLRSTASRPILKLAGDDDEETAAASAEVKPAWKRDRLRATLSSGSKGYGRGAARAGVSAARTGSDGSLLRVSGSVGRVSAPPGSSETPLSVSSAYERRLGPAGSVGTSVRFESHPEIGVKAGQPGVRVATISSAERFEVGDLAEVEAGSRVQVISGREPALVTRPFLRVSAHPNSRWTVSYNLATAADDQDYESALGGEGNVPATTRVGGRVRTETGLHQEVGVSRATRSTLFAISYYADALEQVRVLGGESGGVGGVRGSVLGFGEGSLPLDMAVDRSNGSFEALTKGYGNSGVNILVTRALGQGTWVALQYCTGTAMMAPDAQPSSMEGGLPRLEARRSQAATIALKARIARSGTTVRTSYRWQPGMLVTAVDPYDVLAGGDYLSLHVRQPIRHAGLVPDGMEFTLDGSNMLAQGYTHFRGPDGRPLYLASSPASVRAGFAFNF